jgi:hypothetical protein
VRAVSPDSRALVVARWCVYLVAGLVPLAASYYPGFSAEALPLTYDQYAMVKFALAILLAGIGLAAWLVHAATKGARVRRLPHLEYVVGALLAWSLVSTLFSVHRPMAVLGTYGRFEGLIALVTYVAIAFVALQVLDSQQRLRELAIAFVIGGSVVSLYGCCNPSACSPPRRARCSSRPSAPSRRTATPTCSACTCSIPVTLALGLALSESGAGLRAAYWVAFALNAARCCSRSPGPRGWRLPWRSCAGDRGMASARPLTRGLMRSRAASRTRPRRARSAFGGLGLGVTNVVERFVSLFDAGSGSVASRLNIWSGTLALVAARPLRASVPTRSSWCGASHASRSAATCSPRVRSTARTACRCSSPPASVWSARRSTGCDRVGAGARRQNRARAPRRAATFLLAAFCVALVSLARGIARERHRRRPRRLIWLLAGAIAALGAGLEARIVREAARCRRRP